MGSWKNQAKAGMIRFSVAYFLVTLVLLYVTAPFIEHLPDGILIEGVLMTLVLLSAVLAVSSRRRVLVLALGLVIPAITAKWVSYWRPDLLFAEIFPVTGLLFVFFVVVHLFRFIFRAPRVDSEVLCASVAAYLLLGLLWAFAYILVYRLVPDAFAFTDASAVNRSLEGFNSLYFSITTLSATGFGDIIPVSGLARILAMTEAMVGMFYMALLISRLVGLYASAPADERSDPDQVQRQD